MKFGGESEIIVSLSLVVFLDLVLVLVTKSKYSILKCIFSFSFG